MPKTGRKLLGLTAKYALPDFAELDDEQPYGQIFVAWNTRGIGICVTVAGKRHPLSCRLDDPAESDGLQIWIDTRNTQSIHRASRFCHHFCLLPSGSGKKSDQPAAVQLPIARAREEASLAELDDVPVMADIGKDGYRMEAWLPAEILTGYDPEANPRLGFYYALRDAELGEQFLSVGRDFPFAHDPSLWSTLELVR